MAEAAGRTSRGLRGLGWGGTPPDQLSAFARRSARALGGLALLSAGTGGAVLLAQTAGFVTGAASEASWLMACGLVSAALAAVAAGLSRAAARVALAAPEQEHDIALVSLHGRGGETLSVEQAQGSLSTLPAGALEGQGLFERIQVADRPAFLAALAASASDGRERFVELRLRCEAPGEAPAFSWMEARIARMEDGFARVQWQDVSEAKMEAQREASARVEAERANDAKSRFLAAMSHELRTPLNSILGFSELLSEDAGQMDAARRADYARIIHESGQHLLGLVNGILDLSRVEAGAYELACEDMDVHALVDGCLEMMALEANRRGVRLAPGLPAHLPPLTADQRAVRQILLNLLSNAVKFTPAGGRVEVSGGVSGGMLVLKVRDTGAGMCSADVARLGEPFFQAGDMEHRRTGSGLGLAVVRGLVDLHRGEFHVASVLGVGTTVTLSLPLCGPSGVVAPFVRPVERNSGAAGSDRRSA
ncbi:HAMP domain-containing sensor histidine kinase [Aquabacter sp. CN5-332]|uniref:sensor histidine kinase n=1 Tax=Aquabacter sp. CN5-332 TaxID=3156608 RepID=UPI0032B57901